jgi:hypothetical protein
MRFMEDGPDRDTVGGITGVAMVPMFFIKGTELSGFAVRTRWGTFPSNKFKTL